jgi:hypothetical protein
MRDRHRMPVHHLAATRHAIRADPAKSSSFRRRELFAYFRFYKPTEAFFDRFLPSPVFGRL